MTGISNLIDQHILNLHDEDYPEKYKEIVRLLLKAISEPEIRRKMDLEDDLVEEIRNKDLAIKHRDDEIAEKDEIIKDLQEKLKKLNIK